MSFYELFDGLFRPRQPRETAATPSASAYLMLARSTVDGRPLSLGIYSTTALATHGRYKYELVDRPYATTRAVAYGAAEKRLRTAMLLDTEPWPEDMQPLVQELLNPRKAADPYRSPEPEPPLFSARAAMRDAGLPWEPGCGMSTADAIRTLAAERDALRAELDALAEPELEDERELEDGQRVEPCITCGRPRVTG